MAPRQPEALVRRLQTMVMIRTLLFLCALFPLLMLSLAACSNDSSDGSVSTTQTPPSSNPPPPQPPPPPPPPLGIAIDSGDEWHYICFESGENLIFRRGLHHRPAGLSTYDVIDRRRPTK